VVSCGKGRWVVGLADFGGADALGAGAALVCRGVGGGGFVLGSTGVGGLADGVYAGARDGASVLVGAMVGAGGGGVVVTGIVGTTAPVGPTGSRDTTRFAVTAMATAPSAMALSVITAASEPYQGSRGGSSMASESL
jgi:hypothetical protein